MLKASGKLKVDVKRKRLTVELGRDFTDYYIWFLERRYWIRFNSPRYGTHITVINDKFHKNIDWKSLRKYNGKSVNFAYDNKVIRGGGRKGFIMFYMNVVSDDLQKIKDEAGIVENEGFKGLHITVASAGKSGAKVVDYWPKGITLMK